MAQLLELSFGLGSDNRIAKTLILGDDPQLIAEILFVLTYFIRCSSVSKTENLNGRSRTESNGVFSPMKSDTPSPSSTSSEPMEPSTPKSPRFAVNIGGEWELNNFGLNSRRF